MEKNLLGIDTGGTFTDFVLVRDDKVLTHKVLSTPDAPERWSIEVRCVALYDHSNL